jgi:hypothetical protein
MWLPRREALLIFYREGWGRLSMNWQERLAELEASVSENAID